ncbi:MAG: hypothetical protein WC565_05640 [Parcubacteria group bacterium]
MSDEELSAIESQIVKVILENRQLRAQNAELHRRLIAQIAQNGELIRQGRTLDGERPEYVTAPHGPKSPCPYGRPIPRTEALEIAHSILLKAEDERRDLDS